MKNLLEIGFLFDTYGNLLTEKQREIIELYYHYDLSLGEISEQLHISRQGVYDSIKKSQQLLRDYEQRLGFLAKLNRHKEIAKLSLERINDLEMKFIKDSQRHENTINNIKELKVLIKSLSEE